LQDDVSSETSSIIDSGNLRTPDLTLRQQLSTPDTEEAENAYDTSDSDAYVSASAFSDLPSSIPKTLQK
jgi:hypothetical protein